MKTLSLSFGRITPLFAILAAFPMIHCGGTTSTSAGSGGSGGTGTGGSTSTGGSGGSTMSAGGTGGSGGGTMSTGGAGTGGSTMSTGGAGTGGSTMSTGGTGGAGTFACGPDAAVSCKSGAEFCKEQDSAGPITFTCVPIPASCSSGDLCSCPDLKPGCALGDGPGAFSCTKDANGDYQIGCFG
jgi:hypothetical protein